jgi:hypothetical protein
VIELTLQQSDGEGFCDGMAVTNSEQGQRNGDDELTMNDDSKGKATM